MPGSAFPGPRSTPPGDHENRRSAPKHRRQKLGPGAPKHRRQSLSPTALAPYFVVAALVHIAAIATQFDLVAAKLPAGAPLAIMVAQFPLLLLTGYFEGRLDYGDRASSLPMWMRIDSRPVKLAVTFGAMYMVVLAAQTWDLEIGSISATPPKEFTPGIRAMWFAMFTLGGGALFFMAAAGIVIPLLRGLTFPLRLLPTLVGALLAVPLGFGLGLAVTAALSSTKIAVLIEAVKAELAARPAVAVGIMVAVTLGPLFVGAVLERRKE